MNMKRIFYSIPLLGLLLFTTNGCRDIEIVQNTDIKVTVPIDRDTVDFILTYGYDSYVTYSYLPYTADSAKINLRLQVDSAVTHLDYFDNFKVYMANAQSIPSFLLIENDTLPLETSVNIYLNQDTIYNFLIVSHVNETYCNEPNKTNTFIIPVQTHKGEICNIAQQDVSHNENTPIHIPYYVSVSTHTTVTIN